VYDCEDNLNTIVVGSREVWYCMRECSAES
jgi:hypothetical protein